MTIGAFCEAVAEIGRRHGGSITSWGRTDKHAKTVGGFAGDPHTWWVGADMIYDNGPPQLELIRAEARGLGLKVLRETGKAHDHYQPLDIPAGPVASYGGVRRTLSA